MPIRRTSNRLPVDTAIENVHFRTDLLEHRDVGWRSLVAALSDLAAMGAEPRAALCALTAPAELSDELLFEVVDGLGEAADAPACRAMTRS